MCAYHHTEFATNLKDNKQGFMAKKDSSAESKSQYVYGFFVFNWIQCCAFLHVPGTNCVQCCGLFLYRIQHRLNMSSVLFCSSALAQQGFSAVLYTCTSFNPGSTQVQCYALFSSLIPSSLRAQHGFSAMLCFLV